MKTDKEIIDEIKSLDWLYNNNDEQNFYSNAWDYILSMKEPEQVEREYEDYLKQRKRKGKPITAIGVDWVAIMETYNKSFTKLWDKIGLPKSIDEYSSIKEWYIHDTLGLIKDKLFATVYSMANFNYPTKSTFYTRENLVKILEDDIDKMFEPIYRMKELISISLEEDPKTINKLISKSSVLNEVIKQGEIFLQGKGFRHEEIPVFEMILKKYNEKKSKGEVVTYRQLTFNLGYSELGLEHEDEKRRLYDRFKRYKKKKRNK